MERRSFSFTAAGQSRSFAGFPFNPERMPRHQSRNTRYRVSPVQINKMLWLSAFINASQDLLGGMPMACTRGQSRWARPTRGAMGGPDALVAEVDSE